MADCQEHYKTLLSDIESRYGELGEETLTSIVGFSAGGPVSLSEVPGKRIFVTSELSLFPEQKLSAEGLRFELVSIDTFELEDCRTLFTAIGDLSMGSQLGHDHMIDVSGILRDSATSTVQLKLFSKSTISGEDYGVYEVVRADT